MMTSEGGARLEQVRAMPLRRRGIILVALGIHDLATYVGQQSVPNAKMIPIKQFIARFEARLNSLLPGVLKEARARFTHDVDIIVRNSFPSWRNGMATTIV